MTDEETNYLREISDRIKEFVQEEYKKTGKPLTIIVHPETHDLPKHKKYLAGWEIEVSDGHKLLEERFL